MGGEATLDAWGTFSGEAIRVPILFAAQQARAGYSPDRLDALVWGLTELLVEPMPHWGIFEYTRQRAEAIRGQNPSPPEPVYAIGSLEWQRQQEQARETNGDVTS